MTVIPSIPTTFRALPDLVGDRIVELLTLYCITSLQDLPDAKPYMATLIRQGEFQDNPVKRRIAVLVNPADPDDMREEPKRSDSMANKDEWMQIDPAEIGGGGMRWIRFTVDIKVFLSSTGENRQNARHVGMWVFGRVEQAIRENRGLNIVDDFGERAVWMVSTKTNKYEGGGVNAFNWNGQLWISALVESPTQVSTSPSD